MGDPIGDAVAKVLDKDTAGRATAWQMARSIGMHKESWSVAEGSIGAYAPSLSGPVDWRMGLAAKVSEINRRRDDILSSRSTIEFSRNRLNILEETYELMECKSGWVLSKPSSCLLHKAIEIGLAGEICAFDADKNKEYVIGDEYFFQVLKKSHVFLLEHDWAKAFEHADFSGEIKMPHEISCFEMRINNKHVCYIVLDDGTDRGATLMVQTSHGWGWLAGKSLNEAPIAKFIPNQVRAVCISLDAEVAEANIVRAPYKLNAARAERGKLPLFDYHVVSLAKRSRAPALPSSSNEPTHHKRLHWRRGHWRHFATHKTWIKWMLVGNPDLGFVDKHYRV